MKLLIAILLLLLMATLAYPQGGGPPVLPPVAGARVPRVQKEYPALKLISRDHQSFLSVKQTADGFTLTILRIPPAVPKMK